MTKTQESLDIIAKEIEKALFKKYDKRPPFLERAFKAYIEGFRARNLPGEEHNQEVKLLINCISQALEHPSLEASSYALNGLRYVAITVRDVFNSIDRPKADELYDHLDACGFMICGLGWPEMLPEYDTDVPTVYPKQKMDEYIAKRDAYYEKIKREHPDIFPESASETPETDIESPGAPGGLPSEA